MSTYDPSAVNVNAFGQPIQGLFDGTPIEAAYLGDRATLHEGTMGASAYVVTASKVGTLKIVTSQKSPSNAFLSGAATSNTVGVVLVTDASDESETRIHSARAMIKSHAQIKRGKEIVGYEWEFYMPDMVLKAGGDSGPGAPTSEQAHAAG